MKYFKLGFFATVCAVNGVIASSKWGSEITFVYGRSATNPSAHCIAVGSVCNGNGTMACTIKLPVNGIATTPTQVFGNSNCSVILTDDSYAAIIVVPWEMVTDIVIK